MSIYSPRLGDQKLDSRGILMMLRPPTLEFLLHANLSPDCIRILLLLLLLQDLKGSDKKPFGAGYYRISTPTSSTATLYTKSSTTVIDLPAGSRSSSPPPTHQTASILRSPETLTRSEPLPPPTVYHFRNGKKQFVRKGDVLADVRFVSSFR